MRERCQRPPRKRPRRVELRDAVRQSDRDAIRLLVQRTEFFHPEEVDVAIELVDERLSRGAASGYEFVLAETGGELVGYACYGPIACTIGSYDLYWIAVDTRFQRHGIGRLLLQSVEAAGRPSRRPADLHRHVGPRAIRADPGVLRT